MTQLATGEQPPIPQNTRSIPLTQGKFAIVDSTDYEWLSTMKWRAQKIGNTFYASTGIGNVYMHRMICNHPEGMVVDHVDYDGLNNCRNNLRVVTHQQNIRNRRGPQKNNTSGHLGVSWSTRTKKWCVRIKVGKVYKGIGYFASLDDAVRARKEAVNLYYGEL